MKKGLILWILAFVLTIITAIYQRVTGPTYPISGTVQINQNQINYKLARSHGGVDDHKVLINVKEDNFTGYLFFKRFKTNDEWTKLPLEFINGDLIANLPHQPPAGKLEYYVELLKNETSIKIPEHNSVVIRFKGDVPLYILIPHVIAMFMSMLLSNRTGLEFFNNGKNLKKLTIWTIATLLIGGFVLGPLTQEYAFGELWTGFPFGYDLTDNKTLIAMIGWLVAFYMYTKSKSPKTWGLIASLILLVVYLIPHSVLGSELDYNKIDKEKQNIEQLKLE
ncbi:MAG: hypothetical protein H6611_01980 [Ignavibacteriales bacterium]|nr:hypothetical protein [Ignavibacteriales bacterium]